ncbi:NACHT domain-containing protein [Streptomyces sp. NPDC004270]
MAGAGSTVLARIGLVTLTMAPPGALGVAYHSAVARHPVLAAGLLAGYELLVVLAGFAGKVFGELQGRWVTRVADVVDRWVQRRTSRFEQAYRRHVRSTHRFVDLKGLATRGDYTPGLEEVFVDVSLAPGPVHTAERESLAGPVTASAAVPVRQSIDEFLDQQEGSCLAVIGAPGTGKTTLLKHLALRLASPSRGRGRRPLRDLPVLLYLRDHAAAVTADPALTLPQIIAASVAGLEPSEPAGWFEQQLKDGRCLVLLDGLDEVAREEDRRHVSAWAERQIERYERNDFVLTSRPHGYKTAQLNRARVLQVQRFTGEQISRFLHGWYWTIERLSTGVHDAGVQARAAAEAEDLITRLRDRSVLYDLAANPLLLTMIANVHRYRGALPGSRAELYAEICQVLLWRRAEAKNVPLAAEEVPGAKKEVVLRDLACTMMTEGLRDIGADRAAELLEPALSRVTVTSGAEDFLASVVASGLLVEREHGLYAFAHLTLQEHLAALHIQHHGLADTLIAGIDDDWWRETTLLYAARSDPAPIVQACLALGTTRALALAFECAEQATELAPDTDARLNELRRQFLAEPPGSSRRRLMTAVTVTRQLRDTVGLSDDTRVTARPVSRELYELFTGRVARPESADPADPAVGITRAEAPVLISWINDLLPEGTTVRLPTEAEVSDPVFALAGRSARHSVWHGAAAPGAPPALWVPGGAAHPWSHRLAVPDGLVRVLTAAILARVRGASSALPVYTFDHDITIILALALADSVHTAIRLTGARAAERVRDLTAVLDAVCENTGLDLRRQPAFREASQRIADDAVDASVARSVAHDLARAVVDRQIDLAPSLAYDMAVEVISALRSGRDDLGLHGAHGWTSALAHDLDVHYSDPLAGKPLLEVAYAVSELLRTLGSQETAAPSRRRRDPRSFRDHAADVLRSELSRHPQRYTVYADEILPTLERACSHTQEAIDQGAYAAAALISSVAGNSLPLTGSLTDIRSDPGRIRAAYLQVAALTLAAAADQHMNAPDLADLYRRVAAGIQILRQRAEGTLTPTETLILVRT